MRLLTEASGVFAMESGGGGGGGGVVGGGGGGVRLTPVHVNRFAQLLWRSATSGCHQFAKYTIFSAVTWINHSVPDDGMLPKI